MKIDLYNYAKELGEEVQTKLDTKNRDYGTDDNPYFNFTTTANFMDSHPEEAAMYFMLKHLAWLKKATKSPVSVSHELLKDRITDIMAYLVIIYTLVRRYCDYEI